MSSKFRELSIEEHRKGDVYGVWPRGFREYVFNSNGGHCSYCGVKMLFKPIQLTEQKRCFVIEHVKSGEWVNDNLIPACRQCNSRKHNKTLSSVTNFILIFGDTNVVET